MTDQNVATTNSGAVSTPLNYDPFAQEALNAGVKQGLYMGFNGNDGMFTYGPKDDKTELVHGTQLAVKLADYRRGWLCWKDKEVVDSVLVGIMQGPAPASSDGLPDHGPYTKYKDGPEDGWQKAGEIVVLDISDEPKIFNFSFLGDTKLNAFARLCGEFGRLWKVHPGEVPVIEISARSFEPKGVRSGELKWAPTYKIVGWISETEYDEIATQAVSAQAGSAVDDGSDNPENYATSDYAVETVTTVSNTTSAAPAARLFWAMNFMPRSKQRRPMRR